MEVIETGSVRVDLLGGTLDIYPINIVLPSVKTLNMATGLEAKIKISPNDKTHIKIVSLDYQKQIIFSFSELERIDSDTRKFGDFEFVARLLRFFSPTIGLDIELSSGAPPGSGLGGSSAMGAVLFKGCCRFFNREYPNDQIVSIVQNIESKILNAGPAGYQDYYPSLYGGILALKSRVDGVVVEQLYNNSIAQFLQREVRLIYSGVTRKSGINNWEVYKGFFDYAPGVREGLGEISTLTNDAYDCLSDRKYDEFISLVKKEGLIREKLFPTILTENMKAFKHELEIENPNVGLKVCGAGGGGCFILTGLGDENISELLQKYGMSELPLDISPPKK